MSDENIGVLIAVLLATFLVVSIIGAAMLVKFIWYRFTGNVEPEIQSVSVSFRLSDENFGLLEERQALQKFAGTLEALLEDWSVGKYDGDEFGGGVASLFFFGPSAEKIWQGIEPEVRKRAPISPISATLIFGGIKARRQNIVFNEE